MSMKTLLAVVCQLIALSHPAAHRLRPSVAECRVTIDQPGGYGDQRLSTIGLWPDGNVVFRPGGPGFVTSDGALGMKFGWQRGVRGQLRIQGRRLDAPSSPLRSEVNNGYGEIGFQASYVIFPEPGCWEVTGRAGDASLTFVTLVTKIGEGPSWRRDGRYER